MRPRERERRLLSADDAQGPTPNSQLPTREGGNPVIAVGNWRLGISELVRVEHRVATGPPDLHTNYT